VSGEAHLQEPSAGSLHITIKGFRTGMFHDASVLTTVKVIQKQRISEYAM
jgi:hypothetical protein